MKITASKFVVRGDIFRLTVPLNAEHSPEAEGEIGQKNRSEKSVRKTGPKTSLKGGPKQGGPKQGGPKQGGPKQGGPKSNAETRTLIAEFLAANPNTTTRDLAAHFGGARSAIMRHLAHLRAAGVVRFVGPARGGHWEVYR